MEDGAATAEDVFEATTVSAKVEEVACESFREVSLIVRVRIYIESGKLNNLPL